MKKYAFAGAGGRATTMFAVPLAKEYGDVAQIVGVFDPNRKRCEALAKRTETEIPLYTDFDTMLEETKPDVVIVATVDRYHHEYIVRALHAGCDVISEKPLTIDDEKCRAILKAQEQTGKKVTVTFNVRFMPFVTRIKELIHEGCVGDILSVHFEWMLDTEHGADYFRRWHRKKENSGGLLVHKATHHFDMVNWLIDDEPVKVNAFGTRRFYGPVRENRGERCLTCGYKKQCEFYFDIQASALNREFYYECESEDGYFRDRCVFDDEINIEDSMSLNVAYKKGAIMSYSLTAHSPYEGYRIVINGTEGRVEAEDFHGSVGPFAGSQIHRLRLYNRQGEEIDIHVPVATGSHGGGDSRLREMLFRGSVQDPLGHMADTRAGIMSAIVGIAANKSMKEGRTIPVEPFEELLSIQKIHVSITPPLCVNAGFLNHATPGIVFLFIPIAKVWFGQKENRQFGLFFSYGLKQAFMCGFQISYIRRIVVVIANERPHGQRRKITRHCLFAAAASGKTQIDMVATEHPRYNRRIGVSRNTGTSALGD